MTLPYFLDVKRPEGMAAQIQTNLSYLSFNNYIEELNEAIKLILNFCLNTVLWGNVLVLIGDMMTLKELILQFNTLELDFTEITFII